MKGSGFAYSLLLFFLLTGVVFGQDSSEYISIEEGISYKEISVQRGTDFIIRLPGGGWYLNRYESTSLSFKTRVTEPVYTEFLIHPIKEGQSYLFFSYMKRDVYILVHVLPVDHPLQLVTPVPGSEALIEVPPPYRRDDEMEVKGDVQEKPEVEHTDALSSVLSGSAQKGPEPENIEHPTGALRPTEPQRGEPEKGIGEREMYYIDRNKQRVSVPYKDENDSFKKGVGFSEKGMFSQAAESLEQYLFECEGCTHRDEAHFRLAGVYLNLGEDESALKHLDTLLTGKGEEYKKEAYLIRADIDNREGRMSDALVGYKKVLEYDPLNSELIRKVGDIYFQLEDYGNALNMYEMGIGKGMESDNIYFRLAIICDSPGKLRDLEKAYLYYKIVIDRYPNSEHYSYAKKRVDFLEKNFYHYK